MVLGMSVPMAGLLVLVAMLALLGIWLVHQRIRLLEEHLGQSFGRLPQGADLEARLQPLERIEAALLRLEELVQVLEQRSAALPPGLAREDLAPLDCRLAALHEDLGELRRQAERRDSAAPAPAPTGPLDWRGTLQQHLEAQGYEAVKLMGPGEVQAAGGTLRSTVEARRKGVCFKGTATLEEGRVKDLFLRPAYDVFP